MFANATIPRGILKGLALVERGVKLLPPSICPDVPVLEFVQQRGPDSAGRTVTLSCRCSRRRTRY